MVFRNSLSIKRKTIIYGYVDGHLILHLVAVLISIKIVTMFVTKAFHFFRPFDSFAERPLIATNCHCDC